jgi:putative ABC transport system permease protein
MNIPYVALRNLRRKPARTWLLSSIVALVSGALFAAALFLLSAGNALRTGADRLGADILVVPQDAEARARTALLSGEPTHFVMERSVLDLVRKVDGVENATPQLFIKPAPFTCCYNVDVFLIGFDPATDFTIRPWLERALSRDLGANEIITGRDVPVLAGDTVPFFGTVFRVAGTMEPTGMDFFDRAVFMSLDSAYGMAGNSKTRAQQTISVPRDRISAVLVRSRRDVPAERVAIRIEHDVPGVKALVSDSVISSVRKQLSGLLRAVTVLGAVLWLVVLMIMAFAFSLMVSERRRELGLLRAMGAAKAHVVAIILGEASLLAAAGGSAGVLLGFAVLASFKNLFLHHLGLPYLFPEPGRLLLLMLAALAVSLLTGLLSALLPSLTVLKTDPYEAIRREE